MRINTGIISHKLRKVELLVSFEVLNVKIDFIR